MLRKLKWRLVGEPLVARYNWCQDPVPGRGPAVVKHWCSLSCLLVSLAYSEVLVRRVPAAVPPGERIHEYPLNKETLIFARQMSRDRAVGIMTSYRLDGPGSLFDIRTRLLCSPKPSRPVGGPTQPPVSVVMPGFSYLEDPGVRRMIILTLTRLMSYIYIYIYIYIWSTHSWCF